MYAQLEYGTPTKNDILRIRFVKDHYMIYITEAQPYNSTELINVLGWKHLADSKGDIHLTIFYKIVNHEVNSPSWCILKPGGSHKNIYWMYHRWIQIFFLPLKHHRMEHTINASNVEIFMDNLTVMLFTMDLNVLVFFSTLAFILQTYSVCHKEVLLSNY